MRLSLQRLPRQPPFRGRHRTLAARRMPVSEADPSEIAPRNIWCVRRNYFAEIGDPDKQVEASTDAPVIFLKAGSSMLDSGKTLVLPSWSTDVRHEVALAVELDDQLKPKRAAIALDLTACDMQEKLMQQQSPWTLAKSFPHSTPIGTLFPLEAYINLHQLELLVEVNGEARQRGNTSHVMFKIPALLEYIRNHLPVLPGDLFSTGPPAGSSPIKPGDTIVAQVLVDSAVLSSGEWKVVAGDSIKQRATQKVVINDSYGGFGLSSRALHAYATAKGLPLDPNYVDDAPDDHDDDRTDDHDGDDDDDDDDEDDSDDEYHKDRARGDIDNFYQHIDDWSISRDDPDLVRIVKKLGRRAHYRGDRLKIVKVPAGVRWTIGDYDGQEWVAEKHNC